MLAAAAHHASRQESDDDLIGWHNSSLGLSAARRKGPTMVQKFRAVCGSFKALARNVESIEPVGLLAGEWPKPEDIVLDAVYKKVRPGTLAHNSRTRAQSCMHANEIRG